MSRTLPYLLIFLSGAAGLGYEILWTRMLSTTLGHEIPSVLAVVAAFFSGLAAGAWFLDPLVSRSPSPKRWYILLEMIIGLWSVALIFLLPSLNPSVSGLIGLTPSPLRHWTISFLYPLLLLFPATFAMGGTLPAMERMLERIPGDRDSLSGLYSANTFGAMSGTSLVTFALLPWFGNHVTAWILATVNFGVAAVAASAPLNTKTAGRGIPHAEPGERDCLHAYFSLFLTGLLGIGFEVLMTRALSQFLENTVYSFAAILVVFLFGTTAGAGVYQWWSPGSRRNPWAHAAGSDQVATGQVPHRHELTTLLLLTGCCCQAATLGLPMIQPLLRLLQGDTPGTFAATFSSEFLISAIFLLLPAMSMGATFCHLAQRVRSETHGVGRALCLNTLGGAFAPLLFGVLLVPRLGIQHSLILVAFLYLLCLQGLRRQHAAVMILLAATGAFAFYQATPGRLLTLAEHEQVREHREGVMASISVVEDRHNNFHLLVNNHFQMGGTTSVFSDRRQGFLPLLLHPQPKNVLFLGVGTGATLAAAAIFPDLRTTGVELVPEVIEMIPHFKASTGDLKSYKNLTVVQADARRYVTATQERYDVIVADLFHPARDGAASLYTREHFEAISARLSDDGIFCQWLPLYQLDLEMFQVVTRTFLEVFPQGQAYLAHYSVEQPIIGLIGAKHALRYPENWYSRRMPSTELRRYLAGFGYDSVYSLLGTFLAGPQALRELSRDTPLNTDEHPVILYRAPLAAAATPEIVRRRLLTLLHSLPAPDPETILSEIVTEEDLLARERLDCYWEARDSFLELGATVEKTEDVRRIYAATGTPLLKIVRKSIDFSAAYFPLISIAYNLYPLDRKESYTLLRNLERANPLRPEAGILRQRLFPNGEQSAEGDTSPNS